MIAKILLRMIIRAGYEFYNIISLYSCNMNISNNSIFHNAAIMNDVSQFVKKKNPALLVAPPKEYNYERSNSLLFVFVANTS